MESPEVTHRIAFEFAVSRRIGWDGDGAGELRDHFKSVCNTMAHADGVRRVNVRADLESASLSMEIDIDAATQFDAEAKARESLSAAISESGASHFGLLSEADESRVRPSRNAWHGLRTPQWTQRSSEIVEVI
jgi:hypothetical protein